VSLNPRAKEFLRIRAEEGEFYHEAGSEFDHFIQLQEGGAEDDDFVWDEDPLLDENDVNDPPDDEDDLDDDVLGWEDQEEAEREEPEDEDLDQAERELDAED
jgi:hypothetical protein